VLCHGAAPRARPLFAQSSFNLTIPVRRMVKAIVDTNNEKNHIPDYTFELQDDLFIIQPRSEFSDINAEPETVAAIDQIRLPDTAYRNTRKHAAGCDIYFLEREGGTCLVVSNPSHKILVVQL